MGFALSLQWRVNWLRLLATQLVSTPSSGDDVFVRTTLSEYEILAATDCNYVSRLYVALGSS